MYDATVYDLIIIGGGPAGLSAAVYASKQDINYLLIGESLGGMATLIENLETFPTVQNTSGYELMKIFLHRLKDEQKKIVVGQIVEKIEKEGKNFLITTEHSKFLAKSLIIASGRKIKHPNIKGAADLIGNGVAYCGVSDAEKVIDKTVAVVGGGHLGLFTIEQIIKFARKVYLIEEKDEPEHSGKVHKLAKRILDSPILTVMTKTKAVQIIGVDNNVTALKVMKGNLEQMIKVDTVFVEAGYEPNSWMVAGHIKGLKINAKKEIIIDKENSTSVDGIFAAGDVSDVPHKQIIVACGEGAKAALAAVEYLEKKKLIEEAKFR